MPFLRNGKCAASPHPAALPYILRRFPTAFTIFRLADRSMLYPQNFV
ncbi:MAG: hypothetical protein ACI4SB_09480 [Acutalibacteraceae bacterium]